MINTINFEWCDSEHHEITRAYYFTQGVRGKHYQTYKPGNIVTIDQEGCTNILLNLNNHLKIHNFNIFSKFAI
jgi:hypothetical protein